MLFRSAAVTSAIVIPLLLQTQVQIGTYDIYWTANKSNSSLVKSWIFVDNKELVSFTDTKYNVGRQMYPIIKKLNKDGYREGKIKEYTIRE